MVVTHRIRVSNIDYELEFRIGKYASDNTALIQESCPQDIWFHLENNPSAHVVISLPFKINKKQMKTVVRWGGTLCKKYSHVSSPSMIMYTEIENVDVTDRAGTVRVHPSYKRMLV